MSTFDLAGTLTRLAPTAEAMALIDTGTLTRPDRDATTTDDDGNVTTPAPEVWTGACAVVPAQPDPQRITGETTSEGTLWKGLLPLDADVAPGDLLTLTASHDPALVDTVLVVREVVPTTFAVLREVVLARSSPTWP